MNSFRKFLENDEESFRRTIESKRKRSDKVTDILVYADWLQEQGLELEAHLARIICFGEIHEKKNVSDGNELSVSCSQNLFGDITYSPGRNNPIRRHTESYYSVFMRLNNVSIIEYNAGLEIRRRNEIPEDILKEMTDFSAEISNKLLNNFPSRTVTKDFRGRKFPAIYLGKYTDPTTKKTYKAFATVELGWRFLDIPDQSHLIRLEPEGGGKTLFIRDQDQSWRKENIK